MYHRVFEGRKCCSVFRHEELESTREALGCGFLQADLCVCTKLCACKNANLLYISLHLNALVISQMWMLDFTSAHTLFRYSVFREVVGKMEILKNLIFTPQLWSLASSLVAIFQNWSSRSICAWGNENHRCKTRPVYTMLVYLVVYPNRAICLAWSKYSQLNSYVF